MKDDFLEQALNEHHREVRTRTLFFIPTLCHER
jgi:hypothetical protein